MKKINSLLTVLCMVFVVAFLHISASGQSVEDRNNHVAISGSGSSVRWDVSASYSSLTMTVSAPDGRVFRKEFQGGNSPQFTLIDNKGERLPDGYYSYELRLTPVFSKEVQDSLKAARARDDAPEAPQDSSKGGTASDSLVQREDSAEVARDLRKRGLLPEGIVKSGGFTIQNGVVNVGGSVEDSAPRPEAEPRPTRRILDQTRLPGAAGAALTKIRQHHLAKFVMPDQVIPDDLIVQGSACVGLDCVNGEVFGFDTIRMKENNTRLQFDDTSTQVGFPTNNWQIRANSSASGGGSFLAFVDQGATGNSETGTIVLEVDAGAPANSLRVNSLGKLGLRTATPVLDIHINTSNTPSIRLEQNNSGGFTAQTWDIGANEANYFVRDVTSGSTLPFRIRPGAPTSSLDISADGDVGVGTASPDGRLHLSSSSTQGTSMFFEDTDTGGKNWRLLSTGTSNTGGAGIFGLVNATDDAANYKLVVLPSGNVGIATPAPTDTLSVNGTASKTGGGSWAVFSDERLKNIKGEFNSGLKALMQLQPLRYEYKKNNTLGLVSSGEHVGFGAQAVQKVIPEAVTTTSTGYLQVNNDPIIWTMLNAIKEQQKEIQQLKAEVRQLRATCKRR